MKQMDKEHKDYERKRHLDKNEDKAKLENTMFDIADTVKKEGID